MNDIVEMVGQEVSENLGIVGWVYWQLHGEEEEVG